MLSTKEMFVTGGQAVVIKLRATADRSVSSKVVEPPSTLFVNTTIEPGFVHWRHMKYVIFNQIKSDILLTLSTRHACGKSSSLDILHFLGAYQDAGENPDRVYSMSRMDAAWEFRHAYDEARKIKEAQDDFCAKVDNGLWDQLEGEPFPEDLQWESLVDVLRGRVKVSWRSVSDSGSVVDVFWA